MQFTKSQIIFLVIGGLIALILALIALGLLPGLRYKEKVLTLTFWGVDDPRVWVSTIANFRTERPDLAISYRQIEEDKYEEELIEAMTFGEGPDIFMFENNWLLKHGDKTIPAPASKMTLDNIEKLFPRVIRDDFVTNAGVYALPLYVDTLAMVYNRTLFDQGKIVFPPKTWEEVIEAISILKIMNGDTIERAAFALGGSSENVVDAADIISAFMLQNGNTMVNNNLSGATFAGAGGIEAFEIYTGFADSSDSSYTWNQSMPIDSEALVRESVAAIFMYAEEAQDLEDRNSFLEMEVALLPQIDPNNEVNVADYWGLTVSGVTRETNEIKADIKKANAWDFVIYATTNEDMAASYMARTGHPPALKTLINEIIVTEKNTAAAHQAFKDRRPALQTIINETLANPNLAIFASQALTARSWLQPGEEPFAMAINEAVEAVLSENLKLTDALRQAESIITRELQSTQWAG